ncbi:MAG: ATP-dependent helicase RecG, partial [Adhaeribacter sp.]|nr:ATP-dependent helicase RecG [Adhaeribacter sp.]
MSGFFNTKIEFLKSIGAQRAVLLQQELNIFTYGDLIQHYPFRYLDRTQFYQIAELDGDLPFIQIKGRIRSKELLGEGRKQRLSVVLTDVSGEIELVWFKGVKWMNTSLKTGTEYIVFGKPTMFNNRLNMAHPEMEEASEVKQDQSYLQPVYSTTEKLKNHRLDSKALSKIMAELLKAAAPNIAETLTPDLIEQYRFLSKKEALLQI